MPAAMATVDEVELLPDADQHKLLVGDARAGEPREQRGARGRAAAQHVRGLGAARGREGGDRAGQAPRRVRASVTERVEASLRRRAGKQPKFSTYQSLTLPPSAFKWGGSDRVTMLTAGGRRTISVRVDRSRGDLRPPLAGRPASLVFRNGEFELHAADVVRVRDDD